MNYRVDLGSGFGQEAGALQGWIVTRSGMLLKMESFFPISSFRFSVRLKCNRALGNGAVGLTLFSSSAQRPIIGGEDGRLGVLCELGSPHLPRRHLAMTQRPIIMSVCFSLVSAALPPRSSGGVHGSSPPVCPHNSPVREVRLRAGHWPRKLHG